MAKDKHQRWAVKDRDGVLWGLRKKRGDSVEAFRNLYAWDMADKPTWEEYYLRGFRCAKVWVYDEPRPRQHVQDDAEREQIQSTIDARTATGSVRPCSHCGTAIIPGGPRFIPEAHLVPHKVFCSFKCYQDDLERIQTQGEPK